MAVSQNVFTKKILIEGFDKYNVFYNYLQTHFYNCLISASLITPLAIISEYNNPTLFKVSWSKLLISCFTAYFAGITAYSVVNKISSLSFSVLSSFKRVFVVLYSAWYFHHTLKPLNYLGIGICTVGLIMYNIANGNNKLIKSKRVHLKSESYLV